MDEKVREIRERLTHPMFLKEPGRHLQSGQARDDVKYLLSLLSEKEKKIEETEIEARIRIVELGAQVKQLKAGAERHRLSKLLDVSLIKKIDEWQGKYIDLGERVQHLGMENFELKARIKELEEEIEKIVKSEYMNSLTIKEKLATLLKKE